MQRVETKQEIIDILKKPLDEPAIIYMVGMTLCLVAFAKIGDTVTESLDYMRNCQEGEELSLREFWDTLRQWDGK